MLLRFRSIKLAQLLGKRLDRASCEASFRAWQSVRTSVEHCLNYRASQMELTLEMRNRQEVVKYNERSLIDDHTLTWPVSGDDYVNSLFAVHQLGE